MQISINSQELKRADALALAVLIHAMHPDVMSHLSLMANASFRALGEAAELDESDALDPAEVFAGGPSAVMPSAADAFAGPQQDGAPLDTGQAGDGAGISATNGDGAGNSTTATNTASPSSSIELDSDGLPWDARIHSSNHKTVADGKWRKRAGVSNDTVTAVTAELRASLAAGPLAASTVAAPPPPAPVAPTSSTTATTPAAAVAPAAAIAPPPPAAPAASAPPAPPAPAPVTTLGAAGASPATTTDLTGMAPAVAFTTIMKAVVDAQKAGKLSPDGLGAVCALADIESPKEIMRDVSKAQPFMDALVEFLASAG